MHHALNASGLMIQRTEETIGPLKTLEGHLGAPESSWYSKVGHTTGFKDESMREISKGELT